MLYVIPFIILLAIAVLLKKREDPNKDKSSDKSKKGSTKKNARKTNKQSDSSQSVQQQAPLAATEILASEADSTTVIDDKFKENIEKLIKARTFYSAEAKINQALNQDSSQHELYLYLVDIHLAQNDEFAIKQLVNYVRSLGLHDIADQAEEKQRNYVPDSFVEPEPVEAVEEIVEQPKNNEKAHKAFDALIIDNDASSFDALQSDLKSGKSPTEELKTFDFYANDDSTSQKPAETQIAPETVANIEPEITAHHVPNLEFSFTENKAAITETVTNSESELESNTQSEQPLSFTTQSLDFNLNQPAQIEVQAPEIQGEDFVFDEKISTKATPLSSETTFKLDVGTSTSIDENVSSSDNTLEFNLDMPVVDSSESLTASTIESEATPEFLLDKSTPEISHEFVLDTSVSDLNSEFSFDTKTNEIEPHQSFETNQGSVSTESLEFSSAPIQEESISTSDLSSDPLAQSFPELLQVNEVELDFQLAERYIQLGAFESAKVLLTQNESKYSAEQREHSENLLNGIAS